ncbi:histidine kinase [Hydrogenoanaerobacterium saccharovorans]|uniref:Histidine kinase n=1 Tax=Hydrogenoanaerobacterium saccharovorans TaxID=474960 RepID=A0A1H7ZSK4_9FIRM|nr:histidine kinase [Hydrogenoanaerobacterium saccharovorans]RPF48420.1 histidine kinase [Hydrogenoanaerobacterium saccharovorans]SEM61246.1 Histidine kinase [Hydrogenoanaerobacterium saccharovorans]
MQSTLFRFKIYRTKLITIIVVVMAVSIFLFGGMSLFFINAWINTQRKVAEDAFAGIEARVHNAVEQTNEFMVRIYSSTPLMQDAAVLFHAKSEKEYTLARAENSRTSRAQIGYFPSHLISLINSSSSPITSAILVSDSGSKGVQINKVSGEIELWFSNNSNGEEQAYYGDALLVSYQVHNLNNLAKKLGEIQFLVSGDSMYRTPRPDAGVCAVFTNGNMSGATDKSKKSILRLWQAQGLPQTQGSFKDGPFNRVFYTTFSSGLYNFKYVALTDTATLLQQNGTTLLLLLAAFTVLDFAVIAWVLYGLRDDAKFLGYILDTIAAVEKGDFKSAESLKSTNTLRHDEYGIIATALQNMVKVLDEYIRIEYQLKIKQQETAMRALQHQINPHFLYNTLEAIRSRALVEHDTTTADAIALLGGLFREVVRGGDIITLQEEFELLKMYLDIMELRYAGNVSYQIELEPEMYSMKTVKFWLQPLAENYFRHGFDPTSEYNLLIATGYAEEDGWRIELIDNGSGIEQDKLDEINRNLQSSTESKDSSIGLRNVYIRLKHFYGEGFSLKIRNNPESGACVSIHIPKKEDA